MNFIFTNILSPLHLDDIQEIYSRYEVVSIEQFPGFAATEADVNTYYLLAYESERLLGYACVKIRKGVLAWVSFGPLVREMRDYELLCNGLVTHCRRMGVLVLRIMPPYLDETDIDILNSTKKLRFEYSETELNWHTWRLGLDQPMDELFKKFSENHRRSIKKARKLNLTIESINSLEDIDIFSEQYIEMYKARGLYVSPELTKVSFRRLFSFYKKNDNGLFLSVRSAEGNIIGGLSISYQGTDAFYYKGYSHPDHRNLPINHLAFYEAISRAKDRGLKFFDFGGYAVDVREGDQLYDINRFKHGFGGSLVTYPKTMLIYTTPFSKVLYNLYRKFRQEEPS